MANLTLYNYFRSSTSYRVRIALHLKNLKFEYIPVHLINEGGEQNNPEYRKINPTGGVPTLMHDQKAISQTVAILEYLDEAFPETQRLYPSDPFAKAKVRQLCENINADIHPLTNLKVTQYLEHQLNTTPEQRTQWSHKWIQDGLAATEKVMATTAGEYSYGDSVTAADIFLVTQLFSAHRIGVDIKNYKTLSRINDRCLALDAFKKAHPHLQIDTPEEFKGKI
ncbi:MAG: maleylacetoacetate isomerase [Bdellovibrionaceae bacterium]|nr:maleylacetoacetate isomerase [Bdellovibrio sp.]